VGLCDVVWENSGKISFAEHDLISVEDWECLHSWDSIAGPTVPLALPEDEVVHWLELVALD
jgi:hypothetical protein